MTSNSRAPRESTAASLPLGLAFGIVLSVACGDLSSFLGGAFPTPGGPCGSHVDCVAEEVCGADGTCGYPWGRFYGISIRQGDLKGIQDGDGSAPDPFVRVTVDGRRIGTTRVVQNSVQPEWNATFEAELLTGSILTLELVDEDVIIDDALGTVTFDNLLNVIKSDAAVIAAFRGAAVSFSLAPLD
jgi:hypothetical protein